jgi:hypothetical protein
VSEEVSQLERQYNVASELLRHFGERELRAVGAVKMENA